MTQEEIRLSVKVNMLNEKLFANEIQRKELLRKLDNQKQYYERKIQHKNNFFIWFLFGIHLIYAILLLF